MRKSSWLSVFDTILPPRCLVCDRVTTGARLCIQCQLPKPVPPISYCSRCYIAQLASTAECALCRYIPLPCTTIRHLWEYSGNQRDVLCFLKYSGRQQLASLLADAVIQSLESLYVKAEAALMPDSVVVVPSSPGSIKQRGFHPVLAVADRVSRELVGRRVSLKEISGFRYTGDGVPQASLSHAMRVKKISGGYQASASVFSGKQVLIVEDVITTGATLYNAASALHSAGASRVDVLALARASNWQSSRQLVYQSFEKQSSPVR